MYREVDEPALGSAVALDIALGVPEGCDGRRAAEHRGWSRQPVLRAARRG